MVQALRRFDIKLFQAVAHIWRQWVTDDSGLNLFIIPTVTALGLVGLVWQFLFGRFGLVS